MTKLTKKIVVFTALMTAGAAGYGAAVLQSYASSLHSQSAHMTGQPTETGQAAFAAIAEIVTILNNDPDTDWTRVNIDRLRNHLVDMNALTLNANVETIEYDGAIEFVVSGEGATLGAIQAMAPAHSKELTKMPDWSVTAEVTPTGAILRAESDNANELEKISALGFFGLMATGAHHQPHHLGMATGVDHTH